MKRHLRVQSSSSAEIDRHVHREFPAWFTNRVVNDPRRGDFNPDFVALATGPREWARRFTAYNVNGFKFRTMARDNRHATQNSGVFGMYGTRSYSNNRDDYVQYGGIPYYGRLVDIIEVDYHGRFPVILFKCEWANTATQRGLKIDELGITSVNFSRLVHTGQSPDDEPYILAAQARQVYYVADEKHKDWHMVVHIKPREAYDIGYCNDSESLQPLSFENFLPDGDVVLPSVRYVCHINTSNVYLMG